MTKSIENSKIILAKKKIRKEILEKLKSQTKEQILKKSKIIKKRLFGLKEFKNARCVVAYVSMSGEVDTHRIIDESIRMGKVVGVPVISPASGGKGKRELMISQITDRKAELEIGPYDIHQPSLEAQKPISYKDMDLILVPAIAFDERGNRLGRGKGYYDRFLKKLPKNALKIGLCFDFQLVESVPILPHDIPVQMLITNI